MPKNDSGQPTERQSLELIQRQWDIHGSNDPLWAVLTDRAKSGRRWTVDAFLQTGREEIDAVMVALARLGLTPGRESALDFGCGAGRLVQGLAQHVELVTGVDIAPSMVAKARELNRCGDRCTFLVNDRPELSILDGKLFDIVYTCRVLQHMSTALSERYIGELVRRVRPDTGVLVFQIPSEPSGTFVGRAMRIVPTALVDHIRRMEMHGLSPARVRELVRHAGGEVVDIADDVSAGPNWKSFRYIVRRPSG